MLAAGGEAADELRCYHGGAYRKGDAGDADVVDGVLDQNLPWTFIGIGVVIAGIAAAFRLPVLAFAVGVYLPLSTMAAVFLGGVLRWFITRKQPEAVAESRRERGILFGSGLVGGGGLTGVLLAAWVGLSGGGKITGVGVEYSELLGDLLALGAVGAMLGMMAWVAMRSGEDRA